MENPIREILESFSGLDVKKKRPVSFDVSVPKVGTVCCSRLIRAIKGKRALLFGTSDRGHVAIKFFYHKKSAENHWRRSNRGLQAFQDRNIDTPQIYFTGYLDDYGVYALLTKKIRGGINPYSEFKNTRDTEKNRLIAEKLILCIANQHQNGVVQQDLNAGNFMVKDNHVYSIDGDHVTLYRRPVNYQKSIDNLCTIFWSLPVQFDRYWADFLKLYLQQRGWPEDHAKGIKFIQKIDRFRRVRLKKYQKCIDRPGSTYQVKKYPCHTIVYYQAHWEDRYDAVIENPIAQLGTDSFRQLKVGREYRIKSSASEDLLLYHSTQKESISLWRWCLQLGRLGLLAPLPLARKEETDPSGNRIYFLLMKAVNGTAFEAYFHGRGVDPDNQKKILSHLACAFHAFRQMDAVFDLAFIPTITIQNHQPVFGCMDAFRRIRSFETYPSSDIIFTKLSEIILKPELQNFFRNALNGLGMP